MSEVNLGSREDVELLESELLHDGFFKVKRLRLKHKKFAGGWSRELVRELKDRGNAACVLPYDPVTDKVVLIEQFRVGAFAANSASVTSPWLLELIAGINDKDEPPEELVRRESVEEAGIELDEVEFICSFLPSSGGSNECIYLYYATVSVESVGGIHGLGEEDEDIRVVVMDREEALAKIVSGEIINASAIIALQWLALNYQAKRISGVTF
jgi:ADP-ribose pyrophosphatase